MIDDLPIYDVAIGLGLIVGLMVLGALIDWIGRALKPRKRRRGQGHRPSRRRRPKPATADAPVPQNGILVDGSNVMHWGGDPSRKVLQRVVASLRDQGFAPIVVFDASVGHRLFDRYVGGSDMAEAIGLPRAHVYVVNKGVVADEVILDMAQIHNLQVVSNDRFRDWRVQFPAIGQKGALVQGHWQDGNVVWRARPVLR